MAYITFVIRNGNENKGRYFVHGEHEADMFGFIENHPNKTTIESNPYIGIEWVEIVLTSADVEAIKDTCFAFNCKEALENIVEGATLVALIYNK